MFLALMPLIRNLAERTRGWVLVLCGCLLAAAGTAIGGAGLAVHTPQITRVGIIVLLVALLGTFSALRARRRHSQ